MGRGTGNENVSKDYSVNFSDGDHLFEVIFVHYF